MRHEDTNVRCREVDGDCGIDGGQEEELGNGGRQGEEHGG
jgi:hypothetical protein